MPIEDVDYLKDNSIRQSYVFIIDSADRDKNVYPTPSEYVTEFTAPFHNVIGFEVLHASIPRTMYNIDVINNKISFFIHDATNTTIPRIFQHVEIAPGEYTIQTLIPELNRILGMHVNNDPTEALAYITAEATSNPPDVRNTIRFKCPYPFYLHMGESTVAETLGFDTYTQKSERTLPILERRYESPFYDVRQLYHSVDIPANVALGDARVAFEGPRGVIRRLSLSTTKWVAQKFTLSAKGYLTQIFAALYASNVTNDDVAIWEVHTQFPPSNTPLVSGTIALSFIDGTLSDSNIVAFPLEANVEYWMIIKGAPSIDVPDLALYYNDVLTDGSSMFSSENSGQTWLTQDVNGVYYNLSITIVVKDEYHVLTAPGIYNLVGPKYIIMRCPEIEENSFRSLAYSKHHLGLAMFRLGVVGYSENRIDFNKVPTREFHPIGKLKRITLRFELPSGSLYDFKGVNHTITFAIHYLEPIQKKQFTNSILNPNYDGNFIQYMYKQEEQEEESEEQEEDYNRDDFLNEYRRNEQYYLPENQWRRDLDFIHRMPNFRLESDDE
jgi:hypothetical protein